MEFSYNYEETMRRLATDSCSRLQSTSEDAREARAFSMMLKFDVNCKGCEIPTFALNRLDNFIPENTDEVVTFVSPLNIAESFTHPSGAETILKFFTRSNYGRLNKVTTSKGETYYGNGGLVLDKDFNPLLFSTAYVEYDEGSRLFKRIHYVIHISPLVFIDDKGIINKSLAKKGIAYYLTHKSSNWNDAAPVYKVVIDDSSNFFMKVHSPDLSHPLKEELNQVLKDNIDEVLKQIVNDAKGNLF